MLCRLLLAVVTLAREEGTLVAEPGNGGADLFTAADANGDDLLSREELKAQMEAFHGGNGQHVFADMDADQDGRVTKEEHEVWSSSHIAKPPSFFDVDTDGNGVLTASEYQEAGDLIVTKQLKEFFYSFDADADGMVSKAEYRKLMAPPKEEL